MEYLCPSVRPQKNQITYICPCMPLTATAHFISRTYIVQFGLVEVSTHPHIVLGMFKPAAYVIQYLGGEGEGGSTWEVTKREIV